MNNKSDNENNPVKDKMHKDRFRITIVGVLIYSLALITVMVLSYTGIKAIFRNYDERVAAEAEAEKSEEDDKEQTAESTPAPKQEKEDAEE